MGKVNVKMLCGISGSGKTTFADRLVAGQDYIKLSIDEFMWRDHGQCGIDYPMEEYRQRYQQSEKSLRARLIELIGEGRNVVLDMTFCHREKRDFYRALLEEYGAEGELVYFPVDFDTAWERIDARNRLTEGPNKARVTEDMLRCFYNGFQHPGDDEKFIVMCQEAPVTEIQN